MDVALNHYREALDYLFARTTGAFKFGLERTRALLAEMGDPHLAVSALHIAGTNGKGSSVATADAILRAKGLRVARYTSPHLVDFRERIVVAGVPIAAEEVVRFIDRWTPTIERPAVAPKIFDAEVVFAGERVVLVRAGERTVTLPWPGAPLERGDHLKIGITAHGQPKLALLTEANGSVKIIDF